MNRCIKLRTDWQEYKAGDIIEVEKKIAKVLLLKGVAFYTQVKQVEKPSKNKMMGASPKNKTILPNKGAIEAE